MSYCPKCGNKVDETMAFCPRCGASLKAAPHRSTDTTACSTISAEETRNQRKTRNKKNKRKINVQRKAKNKKKAKRLYRLLNRRFNPYHSWSFLCAANKRLLHCEFWTKLGSYAVNHRHNHHCRRHLRCFDCAQTLSQPP